MSGISFFQTMMGRKFYEADFPLLIKNTQEIASAMKKQSKAEMAFFIKKESENSIIFDQVKVIKKSMFTQKGESFIYYDCEIITSSDPGGVKMIEVKGNELLKLQNPDLPVEKITPDQFVPACWDDVAVSQRIRINKDS